MTTPYLVRLMPFMAIQFKFLYFHCIRLVRLKQKIGKPIIISDLLEKRSRPLKKNKYIVVKASRQNKMKIIFRCGFVSRRSIKISGKDWRISGLGSRKELVSVFAGLCWHPDEDVRTEQGDVLIVRKVRNKAQVWKKPQCLEFSTPESYYIMLFSLISLVQKVNLGDFKPHWKPPQIEWRTYSSITTLWNCLFWKKGFHPFTVA